MSPISLTATFLLSALLASPALAHGSGHEEILSTVIFHRHGDRTPKLLGNTHLTPLGQNQLYESGVYYASRYVTGDHETSIAGLSASLIPGRNEINFYTPDEVTLGMSASSFASGFYTGPAPYSTLSDGTNVTSPVSDGVYAVVHSTPATFSDAIWLKGDDGCPASEEYLQKTYFSSVDFLKTNASTHPFYTSLTPYFAPSALSKLYQLDGSLSFQNAFLIYDYLYFRTLYRPDSLPLPSASTLATLKSLADTAESALTTYSPSSPLSALSARTLLARVTDLLATAQKEDFQKNKLTYLSGSYDTILSLFSLLGFNDEAYRHVPEYGASFVFELVQDPDEAPELRIAFRNGTASDVPLQVLIDEIPFTELVSSWRAEGKMVETPAAWCGVCQSEYDFCKLYDSEGKSVGVEKEAGEGGRREGMNNANAGVIGAMVTLVVLAAALTGAWGLGLVSFGRRRETLVLGKTMSAGSSVVDQRV